MGGWVSAPPRHTLSRRLPTTTRSPRHRPRRVEPPLGGSMRPCAAPGLRGHTAWLGGVAAWVRRGFFFPWVQSRRALAHLFASPAGDSAIRRPRRSGCARLCALRARTARIRLRDGRGCWWRVSTQSASPHRSPVCTDVDGEEAAGSHAWAATERVLSSCTLGRGVLAEGEMSGRIPHGRSRAGGGLGSVLGARRGVGGDARGAVAVSLAREDHTTTKEQSLVGFGTLGKLRASAIFFLPNAFAEW